MQCRACDFLNAEAAKFCAECGGALVRTCTACAAPVGASAKFCSECGAAVAGAAVATTVGPSAGIGQTERRLVSVLFADLVGYTALSEGRDYEDVRELQTRYFDAARTVIGRYGGTVEKFIGDAVMALWGAPVAREDDAERAVRAALDLVEAVEVLAVDAGVDGLRLRAGVLTGEAAVALQAEGQGMVTGDLVNTASRIQGAAEPGTVLVGDATRRASTAAIVYADAGERELKGKSEPVRVWQALRVGGQRHGGAVAAGFEAPFVGRTSELRLVKEHFHASADESRARLVTVIGVAGIGKSRLSQEFERYVGGLAVDVWWHRGRCLSYGDGVAYWALAEMVRSRAQIVEEEDPASAVAKLRAMLELHVVDAEERAWIEPRLLHLLGLAERSAPDREDLFAAWRRFLERLAEQGPLVMVLEDIHWADEGLIAFVDYLLDWGRHHPIFVLALARPELVDRHPRFPGATRSATTLPLEPLSDTAMDELLTGLVPGLPDETRLRLREAADGIPLYAVETVRMLRDRGLLGDAGGDTVVTGDLSALEVPETLHALIASRLDALPADARRLLQDASVLGKTFTRRGLAVLSGLAPEEVERLVTGLVRKELLAVETDPFSPERGQLGFLQALVQRVTYESIARRDRRARHLAVAGFLATDVDVDPDEIAEVIASHYLDAHEADPEAADRDEVRAEARRWFTRAADRAASLAASLEAQRAFERAAALAADEVDRGRSLARAGELAVTGGRMGEAQSLLEEAIAILGGAGLRAEAAAALVRLGEVFYISGRIEDGVARLEEAVETHEAHGEEAAIATVSAQLARLLFFEARLDDAMLHVERAIELAERLRLPDVVVEALINKALILQHRPNESLGLMRQALVLAEESGVGRGALRASMNLCYLLQLSGRDVEATDVVEKGIALARRRGDRLWERSLTANLLELHEKAGRWDEAERVAADLPDDAPTDVDPVWVSAILILATVALRRGHSGRTVSTALDFVSWRDTASRQALAVGVWARALVAFGEGRADDALAECIEGLSHPVLASDPQAVAILTELGGDAARDAGMVEPLERLVELAASASISPNPNIVARVTFLRVRLAALQGAEPSYEAAASAFRSNGEPFWEAVVHLEHAEWLAAHGRLGENDATLEAAREVFERLRAAPYLQRLARLGEAAATPA